MKTLFSLIVVGLGLIALVSTFSPPVRVDLLQKQHYERVKGPQALLSAPMDEEKGPRAMRTMNGMPGSAMDLLRWEQSMKKWRVAPPAGFRGQSAEPVGLERVPIGPPGSDAAAMSKTLSYGPPGRVQVAGPPASIPRSSEK
ncbi:uncharacterized protein [Watersipora subatra]|uniref:uncharacterized protein n=1 Tax=Watersipora subatra TaxID=2589382 RepID=UPI00355C9B34